MKYIEIFSNNKQFYMSNITTETQIEIVKEPTC